MAPRPPLFRKGFKAKQVPSNSLAHYLLFLHWPHPEESNTSSQPKKALTSHTRTLMSLREDLIFFFVNTGNNFSYIQWSRIEIQDPEMVPDTVRSSIQLRNSIPSKGGCLKLKSQYMSQMLGLNFFNCIIISEGWVLLVNQEITYNRFLMKPWQSEGTLDNKWHRHRSLFSVNISLS